MARQIYSELLRDPRWQKKRLEILQRDRWSCMACGDATKTLHVHHKVYSKGAMPWEYEDRLLVTLCAGCHEGEEEKKLSLYESIGRLPTGMLDVIRGMVDTVVASTEETSVRAEGYEHAQGIASVLGCPTQAVIDAGEISPHRQRVPREPLMTLAELWEQNAVADERTEDAYEDLLA
jgi:hypothetical protein